MRHLTLGEVVELHGRLIVAAGGAAGIRDLGLLESALALPQRSPGQSAHECDSALPRGLIVDVTTDERRGRYGLRDTLGDGER